MHEEKNIITSKCSHRKSYYNTTGLSSKYNKSILITGSRGIPARHGGFETLVHNLAPYLAERGWKVTVYCQEPSGRYLWKNYWRGVLLVHIPSFFRNPYGSILFDLISLLHVKDKKGIVLTLGYNTAIFNMALRFSLPLQIIHMDGIEWKRLKWNGLLRLWFRFNEQLAVVTADILIADHPEISRLIKRLKTGKEVVELYYGADFLKEVDDTPLYKLKLEPGKYCLVIARPEPENSILEIVEAWSLRKRGMPLVVLGDYSETATSYARMVRRQAGPEVIFPGAVYEKKILDALRYYCKCYVHGHTVGGTNPSLVEAMGASNFILAKDNKFNRWVTGTKGAVFFTDIKDLDKKFSMLLSGNLDTYAVKNACVRRFLKYFTWEKVLSGYEQLLERCTEFNAFFH